MVQPPDDYSFKRKYICGLPHSLVKSILEACGISTKHLTIEEILEDVQRMEIAQKAISLLTRHGNNPGGKSSQTKPQTKYQLYEKKGREGPARNQGDKPQYFKKGNTLYHHQPRPQGSGQRNNQRHETRGIYEPQKKELQGWSPDKGKPGQKFLHGIYCFGCKKEGHMANDCPDKMGGSHPKVRPRLFVVEIQSDQDEVTIQEEVEQVEHDDEGPTVENPQGEIEGDENPIEEENNEKQILYVKDDYELDNNNKPVAYLGTMRKDEESSEDKHIVQCAMMHGEPIFQKLRRILHRKIGIGRANTACCTWEIAKNAVAECNT